MTATVADERKKWCEQKIIQIEYKKVKKHNPFAVERLENNIRRPHVFSCNNIKDSGQKIVRRVHCTCKIILRFFFVIRGLFTSFELKQSIIFEKDVCSAFFAKNVQAPKCNFFLKKIDLSKNEVSRISSEKQAVYIHWHNNIKIFERERKKLLFPEIKDKMNEEIFTTTREKLILKMNCVDKNACMIDRPVPHS